MGIPNFKVSHPDFLILEKIAARAWKIGWVRVMYENPMAVLIDATAVHANGNPLLLDELLAADDFNFEHDLTVICHRLDRDTGKLAAGYTLRYSQRDAA